MRQIFDAMLNIICDPLAAIISQLKGEFRMLVLGSSRTVFILNKINVNQS